jgi:YidC/Oxa1 family membrane protein insertase
MDTQKIVALVVFAVSGLLLWEGWQKHNRPPVVPKPVVTAGATASATPSPNGEVPTAPIRGDASAVPVPGSANAPSLAGLPARGKRVSVKTDLLAVELDTQGGDIRNVQLLQHTARGDKTRPFTLMGEKAGTYYITQSGLLGKDLPNHTAAWTIDGDKFELGTGDKVDVTFLNTDKPGVTVTKTYTFKRGTYLVDVKYDIKNASADPVTADAYFQFLRDANPPEGESSGSNIFTGGIATFTGPAVYTEAKKYQKVAFSDVEKKDSHVKESTDGWVAMVQHYFVSAWLPQGNTKRDFFTKKVSNDLYSAGVIVPLAAAAVGAQASVSMPLYLGPQEQEKLKTIAPGLDAVVDYGVLTVIAYPMFQVLSWIYGVVGNWGWTIILFTILIKILFYPLNQKAGKSTAAMKRVGPKIEALKARYGDDKMAMSKAQMALFKEEKINPMGGCLPMLVQMPFFFALYWVLLGAVELRNAPWIGWIQDLSTPDPFYVLPVIMGISMFVQSKLNPAPSDPVQAKVMTFFPIIFSVMFLFFPSGLVLYWAVQNILGIVQQWNINRTTAVPEVKPAKR